MPIKIGILGAARIAPSALIRPARTNDEVEVVAIAAREMAKAQAFASKHGIAKVHGSYRALLDDPAIDAVYNPLPNGLHGYWTIAAIKAGKHVLCEKPFTANAAEAENVAALTRASDRVVMEAFHYRYHALTRRMLDIIGSGELGAIKHIDTRFCIPLIVDDIRWNWALAGGSLMDVGCYAIHLLRTLAGAEPTVVSAVAKLKSPNIDRYVRANMRFPNGSAGAITASMLSARLFSVGAHVIGSDGDMTVTNFVAPQWGHRLDIRSANGSRREKCEKTPTSYGAQLSAFAAAVLRGTAFPTRVDDAIANMKVIDDCYRAAGLPVRQPTPA